MKQVAVIGVGPFGQTLARDLMKLKCEVLAIDISETAIDAIKESVTRAVIADAKNLEALKELISEDMDDVVVCMAENIETSILCALHLQTIMDVLYGFEPRHSRVVDVMRFII